MTTLIKVGGSLLSLPDLGVRIERLIAHCADDRIALLVGGGEAADAVRQWDRIFSLTTADSHRLAIESLSLTAALLVHLISDAVLCRSPTDAEAAWNAGFVPVLVPLPLLAKLQPPDGESLPAGWHVTSDSIAAWFALHWPFDRLVLAKSVTAPPDLLTTDSVDEFFATLVARLPAVWWCNLRSDPLVCAECKTR